LAVQKEKPKTNKKEEGVSEAKPKDLKNKELDESIEDLIDEIDEVLEDAQVATTFVQKGGE
jgi:hypothetical protein